MERQYIAPVPVIGEAYFYKQNPKKLYKLKSTSWEGMSLHFECGHTVTDNVFFGFMQSKNNNQLSVFNYVD